MRWIVAMIVTFLAVWGYLSLRGWLDRKKEKAQDMEIVREDEEHLGTWAYRSDAGLIRFRLHRNGKFTYSFVDKVKSDSNSVTGTYQLVSGNDILHYPRLIAIDDKKDTVFNYYIAYVTPYDSYASNNGYDKMVLNPNGRNDTVTYTFFRIKEK